MEENKSNNTLIITLIIILLIVLICVVFLILKNNYNNNDSDSPKEDNKSKELLDIKSFDDYIKIVSNLKSGEEYQSVGINELDDSIKFLSYDCDNNDGKEITKKIGTADVTYTCSLIKPTYEISEDDELEDYDYYPEYNIEGTINKTFKFKDSIKNSTSLTVDSYYVTKDNIINYKLDPDGEQSFILYDNNSNILLNKKIPYSVSKTDESYDDIYAPITKNNVIYYITSDDLGEDETTCHINYVDLDDNKTEKELAKFNCIAY